MTIGATYISKESGSGNGRRVLDPTPVPEPDS
jgi:hypothetical protein